MRNEFRCWARTVWKTHRFARIAAALVCLTLVSIPAWAKPSAEELAVARQQFDKAVAAEAKNDWAECEAALGEAIGIVETPGLRFHQAHCKEQQNKWVEALVDYKRAEELIAGGVKASDVEPLLEPAITRLEGKVPSLTVTVRNAPEQVTFYLDGKERSPRLLGKVVQLNPGSHTIEVAAHGYSTLTKTISLKESERAEMHLRLEASPEIVTSAPKSDSTYLPKDTPRERGSKPLSAKPFVLVGEGAVAAVALGFSLKFYSDKLSFGEAKDRKLGELGTKSCANKGADEDCTDLRNVTDNERKYGEYALYCAIGGAAAVAILATTWLVWDDSPRVVVAYDPTFRSASFTLSGTF